MYRWRSRGLGDVSVSDLIRNAAAQFNVPYSLAVAVATKESGLNQSAVGSKGELGVFQLMSTTAAGLGVDPSNLTQNVEGGVKYLSQLYNQFGDWRTALVAYNGGPGNVARGTTSNAAQSYADSVLSAAQLDSPDLGVQQDSSGLPVDLIDTSGGGLPVAAWVGIGLAAAGLLWVAVGD